MVKGNSFNRKEIIMKEDFKLQKGRISECKEKNTWGLKAKERWVFKLKIKKTNKQKRKEIKLHQWKKELKPKDKIKWKQMSENIGENADKKSLIFRRQEMKTC